MAQGSAQLAHNRRVPGSNPGGSTGLEPGLRGNAGLLHLRPQVTKRQGSRRDSRRDGASMSLEASQHKRSHDAGVAARRLAYVWSKNGKA